MPHTEKLPASTAIERKPNNTLFMTHNVADLQIYGQVADAPALWWREDNVCPRSRFYYGLVNRGHSSRVQGSQDWCKIDS